ncbi:MAG: F0F1 ATP synthase subunit delta [Deltaproteobacteria bacterium]
MTFNLWTFLLEAFNFLVLAWVLHRLLYRPLREAIDRRREAHERAQAEAEKARDQARALQEQLQAQIADLDRQRQETLRQAHEQAAAERQRMLNDAGQAVQQRQEASRTALAREREETLKALRTEVIAQAVDLARRLLSEAASIALDSQLTSRLVESLRQCPDADREELRRVWNPQDVAVLETAGDLDGGAVEQVTGAVAALLGQPVSLTVARQPSLISGARLRLGGRVWDASVAGQLDGIPHAEAWEADHA